MDCFSEDRYIKKFDELKVDFIENREPMGKVRPMFRRERDMCLNDAIEEAENRFMNDTTTFRESLMGSQMAKRNSEMWQVRYFPKRLMGSGGRTAK
jgi:hypothetical protein